MQAMQAAQQVQLDLLPSGPVPTVLPLSVPFLLAVLQHLHAAILQSSPHQPVPAALESA
jgi:hypothetical protein